MGSFLVGIDEVGRGCLAGPVTLGVFGVNKNHIKAFTKAVKTKEKQLGPLRDSKKLSPKKRREWELFLKRYKQKFPGELVFSTISSSVAFIEERGISKAITYAAQRGLRGLFNKKEHIALTLDAGLVVDKKKYPQQESFPKADEKDVCVAFASILAKEHRDRYMKRLHNIYPEYGFASHVGYGTKRHRDAIKQHGTIRGVHRKSWCKNCVI